MSKTEAQRVLAESRARELADDVPAIRQELKRISESQAFRTSRRSQIFLNYVVETALAGHFDGLKERVIGATLFSRAADYDTGADSIVRGVASETRRRLRNYYAETAGEPAIRIELSAGSYMPIVHYRRTPAVLELLDRQQPPAPLPEPRHSQERRWILATAVALLAALCLFLAVQNFTLRKQVSKTAAPLPRLVEPWSAMLAGDHGLQILLADTSIGGIQNLLHQQVPLSDYVNRQYIPADAHRTPELESFLHFLLASQYTSASYASTAVRVAQFAQARSVSASVSFARDMSIRTFKGGDNFVILGTTRANPWVQLFDAQLNFVVEYGKNSQPTLRNRSPRPGEAAIYAPQAGASPTLRENYGHIAFLPATSESGHVLLITGTNSEATEAAGDFVTNVDRLRDAIRKLGVDPIGDPRPFEILLKVSHTSGAPIQSEMIAGRSARQN